ncbi:MAG: hypothetical protein OSJ65_02715 [Bacilli bacterium]|nr:hypothetical protein [Bacilli bacterium]
MSNSNLMHLKKLRSRIIYNKAISRGKIKAFSEDIYDSLRQMIYVTLPAIIYIKFERPLTPPGNCMDRAYIISAAIKDSNVVCGKLSDIGIHYWVEKGETCYDPTSLYEYDKDVYYSLYGVKDVFTITSEELAGTEFIKYCHKRNVDDISGDPNFLRDLEAILPIVWYVAYTSRNVEYQEEIKNYLSRVGYLEKKNKIIL